MDKKEALYYYLLRLGDSNLILGQRMAEWCSRGPILEEDLALTNISLDLFGQANFLLQYAAEIAGNETNADALAFKRSEREYYNYLIVEYPNGDFAQTMVRQFLYSSFALMQYEALCSCPDHQLAAIAAKAVKEFRYHVRHSAHWIIRLGKGTEESHQRTQAALNRLWSFTGNLFETDDIDKTLIREGVITDIQSSKKEWEKMVKEVVDQAELILPEDIYMQTGSLQARHTEHLGHLLSEMQYLQRAYPDAVW